MAPGSHGLGAFVRSLEGQGRRLAIRFAGAFVALSLLWAVVAPAYAALLAVGATVAAPILEPDTFRGYQTERAKIVAVRRITLHGQEATVRQGLWDGRFAWNLVLLVSALVAVPSWAGAARRKAIASAIVALFGVHLVNLWANVVYTQLREVPGGPAPDTSSLTASLVSTLSFFFDTAGNGFFALLLFTVLVAHFWRPPASTEVVPRNAPCPCGSGRKAKRCCQQSLAT